MKISAKIAKEFQSLTVYLKPSSQKSNRSPNTCFKIVVRKLTRYKLKQKRAKKVEN